MEKKTLIFILLFLSQIILINSQDENLEMEGETEKVKPKKPKHWTPQRLYKYLNETYLHPNNPNKDRNIKYFIFDPENYCKYEEMEEAENTLKILAETYNVSTHIFFISHMKDKYHDLSDYVYEAFVDKLDYLIYKDHPDYNENMTLTAVFFLKDLKMRIKTTKQLKKIFGEIESLNILNRRKKDLRANNYQEVANGFVKDIYKHYLRKTENPHGNLILLFTVIFILGVTMLLFLLNREESSLQEDKVKIFLDKIKKKDNLKEIFNQTCIICLDDFKPQEIKDSEKKELLEKEDITLLECGHKYHKKCISDWIKKDQKCPLCKAKIDNKEKENNESKTRVDKYIIFNNVLTEILRIQENKNLLNEVELNRIRRLYHPDYAYSSNKNEDIKNNTSNTKNESSSNKGDVKSS
jgi:hypothetical protein